MKVKRVLSKRYRSRTRSFSKERARDSKISFPLTAARRSREKGRERERERDREWKERERERDFSRTLPFFHSGCYPQRARVAGMHKNLTPTRSFLSVFTLQMHKKRSPTEWVVYTNVSCTFPREDLCEYNALALSLLLLNGVCVCLCGPKSCFFSPLSPFVDLMTSSSTKQLQRRSQKIKKKRDRSLSFSLFHEKALFEVRDAFSLLLEIVESKKKKRKKIQNLREERLPTRARAQEEREKKTSEFERIELFSSSRCVLSLFFAFARRRGRNFARRIERERGQRFAILLKTPLRER